MGNRVNFSADFGTRFAISVDTEEEFAWHEGFARDRHDTAAVPALRDGQRFFSAAGVAPIYFVDTPILDCPAGQEILAEFLSVGVADVGAHLHPWVTPPFDERITRHNSYVGNLPEALERAKIRHVRQRMLDTLGHAPLAYRAGRYGIGPNTYRILHEEGFIIDSSVRTLFDYRSDGGPDFRDCGHHPTREGPAGAIVELPLTSVYTGLISRFGRTIYSKFGHSGSARTLLSRGGLVQRVPITPEGTPARDACRAIDVALDIDIRLLMLSFHSPSLAPGNTPYVRNTTDLAAFYGWFDSVFNHCAKRGILPARLDDIIEAAGAYPSSISGPINAQD